MKSERRGREGELEGVLMTLHGRGEGRDGAIRGKEEMRWWKREKRTK